MGEFTTPELAEMAEALAERIEELDKRWDYMQSLGFSNNDERLIMVIYKIKIVIGAYGKVNAELIRRDNRLA